MGLHAELEDLTLWKPNKLNDAHPKQLWKIITSEELGITFPIITSYLISSERGDVYRYFRYRLKVLFGSDEFLTENELNRVRSTALLYNPFSYAKRPIFSKHLEKKVFKKIKENLNSHFKPAHGNCENSNISAILTAASSMLECAIFLYRNSRYNYKSLECYNVKHSTRALHIFCEENVTSTFGYGIMEDDALHLRRISLNQISRRHLHFDSIFFKFGKEIFMENQFLISVLKSPNVNYRLFYTLLGNMLNLPRFALALIEAGLNINLCMTDENGLSAFLYAVKKGDASVIRLLYNYAFHNSCLTDDTSRKQEIVISTTLECIKETLEKDQSISENFSLLENKEAAIQFYLQIMHFNAFQIKIINDITASEKGNSNNIAKNQQLVIALIDTYKDNFYFGTQKASPMENFKNYIDFNVYYHIFDSFISSLIFEYILSLEPILNDAFKSVYFDTISSFFLLIQSKEKYPVRIKGSNINYEENFQIYISLYYRENFLENVLKLKAYLENVNESTGANKSRDIVKSFSIHHPEISSALTALRLKYYLSVEKCCEKSKKMFVMKRVLQVLDELTQDGDVTRCPVKIFLCSCLQDNADPKLTLIRKLLPHSRSNSIHDQLHLENNSELFKELHTEFEILSEIFTSIEAMQLHKVEEIMIENGINEARKYSRIAINSFEEKKNLISEERKKSYKNKISNFLLLRKNTLNYIKAALDKKKRADYSAEENTETVKNRIEALVHLLEYMVNCTEDIERVNLKCELESFRSILSRMKVGDRVSQQETDILSLLSKSSNTLSELYGSSNKTFTLCSRPITEELFNDYFNPNIFSADEEIIFKERITTHLEKSKYSKNDCLKCMDSEESDAFFKSNLSNIITTEKNKRLIQVLEENNMFEAVKKSLREIKDLTPDCIFKLGHHTTDTILSMLTKDDQRFLLLKVYFKLSMRKKIQQLINQRIYFLINRIDKLKSILIDGDKFISYLWSCRNKNETARRRVKTLICQRCFYEHDTRIAAEMLLFDCSSVCGDKEDTDLWIEANDLFTGISLRNNITHFYPLVQRNVANARENVADPRNFRSASIDNIVDLIDDKEALVALLQLWMMKRKSTLINFISSIKHEYYDHQRLPRLPDRQLQRQKQLRKLIKSSKRWERYAKMLSFER